MQGRLILAFASLCLMSFGSTAESLNNDLIKRLIQRTGADAICALNQDSATRYQRNVLVIASGGAPLRALMVRFDQNDVTTPAAPCWATPGHCALFEGVIPVRPAGCTSGRGMSNGVFLSKLFTISDPANADPALIAFARDSMRLVNGLRPEDDHAALLGGIPVYMTDTASGERRARIELSSGAITIDMLRVDVTTIDLAMVNRAINKLGTRHFVLVGPRGMLSNDGRAYLEGSCIGVVSPEQMRVRLEAANAVFELKPTLGTGMSTDEAFNDLVQTMLGGEVVHGRPLSFDIDQDPRMFLIDPAQMSPCS